MSLTFSPDARHPQVDLEVSSLKVGGGGGKIHRTYVPCVFAGGPGQLPHLAPTYASVMALCTIGTEEAFNAINR